MLFSKTIKLLICLVIIMPYIVQAPQASAAVNYDHNALSEYKGYGEVMYETIVDQTTFVTGQYTSNKEYVKDSIGQIKDYADFWLKEQGTIHDACSGTQIFTKNCLGELTSSVGGYALTVGDFVKNLFTDYDKKENDSTVIDGQYFITNISSTGNYSFTMKDGYKIVFSNGFEIVEGVNFHFNIGKVGQSALGIAKIDATVYGKTSSEIGPTITVPFKDFTDFWKNYTINRETFNSATGTLKRYFPGFGYTFKKMDDTLARPKSPFGHMNDHLKQNPVSMVTPQPKAYLSCPDGTKINMAINGATFLDATGKVMNVNKDGTAQVSSQICNLGWEKPKVDYVDDTPAITDPDGNWMDIITGEMLECVLLDKCEVSKPKPDDEEEIEPLDGSLVEYVKNAYEYATNVLKTGTDGLKSLAMGAKELTSLFGVFFSWLPKEMVVLMSSGLAIAVGLRLFRK